MTPPEVAAHGDEPLGMGEWLRERSRAVGGRSRRVSLRARITWLVAAAVALAVALVSLVAFLAVRDQLDRRFDEDLLARTRVLAQTRFLDRSQIEPIARALSASGDVSAAILTETGQYTPSATALPPPGPPELAVARGQAKESLRTVDDRRVAAVWRQLPDQRGAPQFALSEAMVVSQPTAPTERTMRRLGLVLLLVGGAGVVGAALTGRAVAHSALRPVGQLTDAAENVARTEQLHPIAVTGDDELARLATAFNAMLAALDQARARQRQLVADAGHELRTPLTSLRTNLDLLAQSEASSDGPQLAPHVRAELLADVRAQVAELGDLVGDLVELSRDDQAGGRSEVLDLAAVVERAVDRVRRRAPALAWDVRCESWAVRGDPQALERAVTNLLDNAAKWGPPGSTVTVRLAHGRLEVTDCGPGIADEDLPRVFDRFYRSAAARAMPGSGLGLSIVAQTAQRHGGTVMAGAGPGGGARFTLLLPAHSPVTGDS